MRRTADDERLLKEAAAWSGPPDGSEHGLDFATAVLHEHIVRQPQNAAFQCEIRSEYPTTKSGTLIGVVPGAFYREHRGTGADGSRVIAIAKTLGVTAEMIPTASFGTLQQNATIIRHWLTSHREAHVTLVSLSKGGADVKHALSQPEAATDFAHVRAWVSISGLVCGTPLIDWLRRRPLRWWVVKLILWWRGHPKQALNELRHGPGTVLAKWTTMPANLRAVHVCGFPLRRHLAHPWALRGYERLAPLGPNDGGGNLLSDALHFPGIVAPVWGADHYLAPAWDATPLLTGIIGAAIGAES